MTHTKRIVLTGLFIALVFVATNIRVHIPLFMAQGGLVHLGTLMSFLIAIKYGARYGALSSGIGMTLFDLLSEWAYWAPGTFVARIVSGYLFGLIALSPKGQGASMTRNVIALAVGGASIIVLYLLFEALYLGYGFEAAILSIPGNLLQIFIASFGLFILKSMPDLEEV
ncbi:MAG: ECF transporter S component [Candidatus Izemoplasmataceae bacterium]